MDQLNDLERYGVKERVLYFYHCEWTVLIVFFIYNKKIFWWNTSRIVYHTWVYYNQEKGEKITVSGSFLIVKSPVTRPPVSFDLQSRGGVGLPCRVNLWPPVPVLLHTRYTKSVSFVRHGCPVTYASLETRYTGKVRRNVSWPETFPGYHRLSSTVR